MASATVIERVRAREVLDSRGDPTVEVEVWTRGGARGRAIVPSGASTGRHEALELRDADPGRYDGRGVRRAVRHVNQILGPAMIERDAADQEAIDRRLLELDPTPRKQVLGGNALLGVSLAVARAAAAARGLSLYEHLNGVWRAILQRDAAPAMPVPMTNMISGGLHAGGNLDIQDVLAIPQGAVEYPTALEWLVRVYRRLGELLREAGYEGRLVGDEGGYGPRLPGNRQAIEFLVRAIERAGLRPGEQVAVALDVAATHFATETSTYRLASEGGRELSPEEMIDLLDSWVTRFPIVSIEDPLAEDDWDGWQKLTAQLGSRVRLVGDDLFVTNSRRIERGLRENVANSVLVKMNQAGTLTETMAAAATARGGGYQIVVSARSGETEDDTIADLAVATAAEHIKIGSVARSERLAKYNRLLRIWDEWAR